MLIKNNETDNNIALHVNHLLYDSNTLNISSYIFHNLQAKWMISSGAHRYARVDSSTAECDEKFNFGADVARNQNEILTEKNVCTEFLTKLSDSEKSWMEI